MNIPGDKIAVRVVLTILMLSVLLGTRAVGRIDAGTAKAASYQVAAHHVADGPLWLHPQSPTIHSQVTDLMSTGTEFDIACFALGDNVYGDAVWDYGTNIQTGHQGYAADKYIDTQVTLGREPEQLQAQGIAECGVSETVPNPGNPQYDRQAVANWALTYATLNSSNTVGGDESCTWFVSLALWSHGFPSDQQWNSTGSHGFRHPLPGTKTAWVSNDLIDHLRSIYDTSYTEVSSDNGGFIQVPILPGDIIAYDLGYKPDSGYPFRPDHLALVVNVIHDPIKGDYPEVAEWGHALYYYDQQGKPTNNLADYAKRGWTWSEVHSMWVQSWYNDIQYGGNPISENAHSGINVKAYLLHFNF